MEATMAQTTTISEVQERAFIESIGAALTGIAIFVIAGILFYFMKFWLIDATSLLIGRVFMGIAMLVGVGILGAAIYNGALSRKTAGVGFACPYCEKTMQFLAPPTDDFECEHCNRIVHIKNGVPAEVRVVTCQACRTNHRVAIVTQSYVCDNCNRPLRLAWIKQDPKVGNEEREGVLQNYDVLLIAFDRRHENELAFKIQSLMVINLNDARKAMTTATSQTPLTVGHDLPQRKAEAIRRQLQELGATSTIRAAMSGVVPTQK